MVNAVLRRLRENEVSSVSATSYAKLIGDFINESKAEVENSWNWSSLRTTLTVVTEPDIFNYELNGTGSTFKVLDVWNETNQLEMLEKSSYWFNKEFTTSSPVQTGQPTFYSFNGVSSDGDTQVDLFPIPDTAYTLRFNLTARNAKLVNDDDVTVLPTRPIVLLALAMAIEERGEDGGEQSINAYRAGQSALSDEISFDAARHSEDTIWYPA
jgi:hypothetical protein